MLPDFRINQGVQRLPSRLYVLSLSRTHTGNGVENLKQGGDLLVSKLGTEVSKSAMDGGRIRNTLE